ncbi:hypothetical protein LCGC14_0036540 [marine sediment metagenome]|uniref:Uncharacterized protein n=1 Tax=marine sediment metagenome TaxID=412755 RepID=A0A0F9WAG5_9ZZZZ|nr:hypothetical protein [Halomonas sp.]HDZ48505.1 hypothetical protein [Halomonas sp.]HEB04729.1 hypothetical protein [Halomonas sp.]
MHSEKQTDLSQAGLQIAIQDIKDELFDTPECDYAITQLLNRWGNAEQAEYMLDEMLLKWGSSPEVVALTQRGYNEINALPELLVNNDSVPRKPKKSSATTLNVVAA